MTKRIFLVAGEPSGDSLGADLMRALKEETGGAVEFSGIGGPLMEAEGMKSLLPMEELCVMGLWEIIGQLPRLMRLVQGVTEEVEKYNPDALITIDLPDFNFHVGQRLKKRGQCNAKVIHYVAPSVWAWRPGRARKVAGFLDGLMCLFPFEPDYFTKHGLRAEFVGHPLVEKGVDQADRQGFRRANNISDDTKVLGLFFGSRESELKKMGETLQETAIILAEQHPDLRVIIPTLPHLEYDVLALTSSWEIPTIVNSKPEAKWDAFAACDVALAVSGTVGLELAYMGVPHVIAYKMHPVTWQFIRRMVKVKYAHLANILLDKPAVPEFLQRHCNSLEIARKLLTILKKKEVWEAQKKDLEALKALLEKDQNKKPSHCAAQFVLSVIGG